MFKRFVIAIVLTAALLLAVGGARAEFNVDGILSPAEQEAITQDIRTAMMQAPQIFKADVYPDGTIVVYYDDEGDVVDGVCDNAVLFQTGGFGTTNDGKLVPYVMPLMQIPTCADAEIMSRMYFEEKGIAPNSVARPEKVKIENMEFNQTGTLVPEEYQKLVLFWEKVKTNYPYIVKVYVHELLGVAMVFIDQNKDGKADYVDHLYFNGFDSNGDPTYFKEEEGSVEEAEAMYRGYLEHMKEYRKRHSA